MLASAQLVVGRYGSSVNHDVSPLLGLLPRPGRAFRATCLGLSLLGAACQLRLDDPTAPDTTGVERNYEEPPGLLSAPNLEELTAAFEERVAVLRSTGTFGDLGAMVDKISQNEEVISSTGEGQSAPSSRVRAVIKAKRVCSGPVGNDVIDAKQFGTITMTLKGGLKGLFPVVWGRFNDCIGHAGERPFTIDGDYSVTVRREAGGMALLIIFDGTIETETMSFDGSLDLRLLSNGTIEVRVSSETGDVVLAVNIDGQLLGRDKTGEWTCDPEKLSCTNAATGQVIAP